MEAEVEDCLDGLFSLWKFAGNKEGEKEMWFEGSEMREKSQRLLTSQGEII